MRRRMSCLTRGCSRENRLDGRPRNRSPFVVLCALARHLGGVSVTEIGLCIESWGVSFEVCCQDSALTSEFREALPPGWQRTDAKAVPDRFVVGESGVISLNGTAVTRVRGGRSRVIEALAAVLRDHVAQRAPDVVFVHAGVVGYAGGAIVIPGRSFSGKTTLVAALLQRGASYFSDEFAVVDRFGLIHPFPKPLSVRAASPSLDGGAVTVSSAQTATRSARPSLIVVTGYRPGGTWAPQPLSSRRTALAILDNTVVARLRPRAALATAVQVAADANAVEGLRGEAEEAAGAILSLMTARVGAALPRKPETSGLDPDR